MAGHTVKLHLFMIVSFAEYTTPATTNAKQVKVNYKYFINHPNIVN